MLLCCVFNAVVCVGGLVWLHTACFIHANYKLTSSVLIFNVVCFVLFYRCVVFHPLASTTTKPSRFPRLPTNII